MSTRIGLLLCLVCVPLAARAQSVPPPLLPPPPPLLLPPPPPAWTPTRDVVTEANALEAAGRRKKHIGVALMATGGALGLVGTGLAIAGAWHGNDRQCYGGYYYGSSYAGSYHYHSYSYYSGCTDHALTTAGATTALIGVGALVPGIIEQVGGSKLVERARLMRQCGGLCW